MSHVCPDARDMDPPVPAWGSDAGLSADPSRLKLLHSDSDGDALDNLEWTAMDEAWQQRVRERAYAIWQREGSPDGSAEQLREAGAGLRSLGEPWADTTSPAGRMVLTVFAGIADFERALIQERTGAGRAAAMRRGVRFGRPAKPAADQVLLAQRLLEEGKSATEVARTFKVHRATLYRALSTESSSG